MICTGDKLFVSEVLGHTLTTSSSVGNGEAFNKLKQDLRNKIDSNLPSGLFQTRFLKDTVRVKTEYF